MRALRPVEGTLAAAGLLAGRLLLALVFVHEGWSLIGGYSDAAAYMEGFGVAPVLLPAVILLELGGGLLIASGMFTRAAASVFALFCLLTAVLFHSQLADRNQLLHFQKDLAIAGGFLVLIFSGPGSWSVGRCFRAAFARRTTATRDD
ncbi:MAG TPA: DoxX family protein [Hyphomicrobiaceae bacterium]|nr:DoxX family protein [Hyphomicrobiaceae bacterium]